jgi:hypothetical protein
MNRPLQASPGQLPEPVILILSLRGEGTQSTESQASAIHFYHEVVLLFS